MTDKKSRDSVLHPLAVEPEELANCSRYTN